MPSNPKHTSESNGIPAEFRCGGPEVWGRVIDQVGSPAEGVRYIHVCNRGADNTEVFCHMIQKGCGWVIRASHLTRRVRDVEGTSCSLNELCQRATLLGQYQLQLRETATQADRTATLEVRVTRGWFPRPQHATPWLKQSGIGAVGMTISDVREVSAPKGVTPRASASKSGYFLTRINSQPLKSAIESKTHLRIQWNSCQI